MRKRLLPGFGLSLGFSIVYFSTLILIPLILLLLSPLQDGWAQFWKIAFSRRVVAAYRLSFTSALFAAAINLLLGGVVAWTLTRYRFTGRRLLESLVDFPFALPTSVAGISFAILLAPSGVFGSVLQKFGITILNSPFGIMIALVFVGFPFVVRTLQPVLADFEIEMEEASQSLGASRWQTFYRVILPHIFPAAITGFTMAFSRGVGEYGSVIFVAGNLPFKTEIAPLLIMSKLDQFNLPGAATIALVLLVFSFLSLIALNALQVWRSKRA